MKKLVFTFLVSYGLGLQAQVGIGTTTPSADLHVAGKTTFQDKLVLSNLTTVSNTDENFELVTRISNSTPAGEVTVLDVSTLNVAPVNTVDYHFSNISLDNLTDVDLQYDTSKYIVSVANFRYVGDPIKKVPLGTTYSIGNFVVNAFEDGGTWHLEIRNRTLDLDVTDSLEYYVTLVVYDKKFFKNLTPITTDLEGRNNGNASAIPDLY